MIQKILIVIFSLGLAAPSFAARPLLSKLELGSHCVAYKTKKRLMMVKATKVFGKSCKIISQVIPELGGTYYFELLVPIKSFESGESERDRDVRKILKVDRQEDLIFKSKKFTVEQWHSLFKKEMFSLPGELNIGGKAFPIKTRVTVVKGENGWEVDGVFNGKFRDFEIDPPKLAAGFMAKVSSGLELHFHFMAQKTLGASSILPEISLVDTSVK